MTTAMKTALQTVLIVAAIVGGTAIVTCATGMAEEAHACGRADC